MCGSAASSSPGTRPSAMRATLDVGHRGPDGRGILADEGVAIGICRLGDHRPLRRGPPADDRRGRAPPPRPQRRGLQLRRAARRARGEGPPLPQRHRHGGACSPPTEEWGARCVERFNGMWAFAIWDEERRTLFCVARPLRRQAVLLPARRRPALLRDRARGAARRQRRGRTGRASATTSSTGWLDHGEETFFEGVRRLPPAHNLVLTGRTACGSSATGASSRTTRPRDAEAAVRELFLDAVRLQLRSDVPVGPRSRAGSTRRRSPSPSPHTRATRARRRSPRSSTSPASTSARTRARSSSATGAEPHWISFGAGRPRRRTSRRSYRRRASRSARPRSPRAGT